MLKSLDEIKRIAKTNFEEKIISKATYLKSLLLVNNTDYIILHEGNSFYLDFKAICSELVLEGDLIESSKNVFLFTNYEELHKKISDSLFLEDEISPNRLVTERLSSAYESFSLLSPEQKSKNIIELASNVNNILSFQNYLLLSSQANSTTLLNLSSFNQLKANNIYVQKNSKAYDLIIPLFEEKEDGKKLKSFKIDKFFDISQTNLKEARLLDKENFYHAFEKEMKIEPKENILYEKELHEIISTKVGDYFKEGDLSYKITSHILSKKILNEDVLKEEDYLHINEDTLKEAIKVYGIIAKSLKLKEVLDNKYFYNLSKESKVSLSTLRKEVLEHGKDAHSLKNIPESEHENFIFGVIENNKKNDVHILKEGVYTTQNVVYSDFLVKKQLKNEKKGIVKTKKQLEQEQIEATNSLFGALYSSSNEKTFVDASKLKDKFTLLDNIKLALVDKNGAVLTLKNTTQELFKEFSHFPRGYEKLNDITKTTVHVVMDESVSHSINNSIVSSYEDIISADSLEKQKTIIEVKINAYLEENDFKMTIVEKNELILSSLDSIIAQISIREVLGQNHLNEDILFNKETQSRVIVRDGIEHLEKTLSFNYDRYLKDISFLTLKEFSKYNDTFGLYNDAFIKETSDIKAVAEKQVSKEAYALISNNKDVNTIVNNTNYENAELLQEALENKIKDLVLENQRVFSAFIDITELNLSSLAILSYYDNLDILVEEERILSKRNLFTLNSFNLGKETTIAKESQIDFSKKSFNFPSSPLLTKAQVKKIYTQIDKAPLTQETEEQDFKKIYAKLFTSNRTFFIVEKDSSAYENENTGHPQAFGYIECLDTPQFSEWGYIDIDAVIRQGAELDLYFQDKYLDRNALVVDAKELILNQNVFNNINVEEAVMENNLPLLLEYYKNTSFSKEVFLNFAKASSLNYNTVIISMIEDNNISFPSVEETRLFLKNRETISDNLFLSLKKELSKILFLKKQEFEDSEKYTLLLNGVIENIADFEDTAFFEEEQVNSIIDSFSPIVRTESTEIALVDEIEIKKNILLGTNIYEEPLFSTGERRFIYTLLNGSKFANYESSPLYTSLSLLDRYNKYSLNYLTKEEFYELNSVHNLYSNDGIEIVYLNSSDKSIVEPSYNYKILANKHELVVSNLREYFSKEEIESLFIKESVVWNIFANEYIFDLSSENHINLLNKHLNIDVQSSDKIDEKRVINKPLILESIPDVTHFSKLKSLSVIYEEGFPALEEGENSRFDTFKDIQENFFLKKYPTSSSISPLKYDKIGIEIILLSEDENDFISLSPYGMNRVDVSTKEGDFNPHKETFSDYIQKAYLDNSILKSVEGSNYVIDIDFSSAVAVEKKNSFTFSPLSLEVDSSTEDSGLSSNLIDSKYLHFFEDGEVTSGAFLKTKPMSRETFKEFEAYLENNNIGTYISKRASKGKEFGFKITNESVFDEFYKIEIPEEINNEIESLQDESGSSQEEGFKFFEKRDAKNRINTFLEENYFSKYPSLKSDFAPFVLMKEKHLVLRTVSVDGVEKNFILGEYGEFLKDNNDKLLNIIGASTKSYLEDELDKIFEINKYEYGLRIRPASIGSVPDGFNIIPNSETSEFPFGLISYNSKLSISAVSSFELIDLSEEHLLNTTNRIVTKMGRYAPKYLVNESHFNNFINDQIGGSYENRIASSKIDDLKSLVRQKIQKNIENNIYSPKEESSSEFEVSRFRWENTQTELYYDEYRVLRLLVGEIFYEDAYSGVKFPEIINAQIRENDITASNEFFVENNYPNFDFNDKLSYQDTLDAKFNERLVDVYNELPFNESLKSFCVDNVVFEKTETNIVGMTILGVEDDLREKSSLLSKIKSSPSYKEYIKASSSTEKLDNFVIDSAISYGGLKTRFKNNMEALEVVKKVEKEEPITLEERVKLSKYVGWGGLSQAFYRTDGSVPKGWEKEAVQLREALSVDEYEEIRKTTLNAHYTPTEVSKAMWNLLDRYGFDGGNILEPSVGNGHFIGTMPHKFISKTNITGVEIDKSTSLVARALYPNMRVLNQGFETLKQEEYSLIIGNPPFGQSKLFDEEYNHLNLSIHNYFFVKSIDSLKNNGIMAMVVSNAFLDSETDTARAYISKKARLITAIRLPNNMFVENANTEVTTDILVFQRVEDKELLNYEEWNKIGLINETPINKYFEKHPNHLLGEWGRFGTMYQGGTPALVAKSKEVALEQLTNLIETLPTKFYKRESELTKFSIEDKVKLSTLKLFDLVDKTIDLSFNVDNDSGIDFTNVKENSFFVQDEKLYYREFEYEFREVTTKINSKEEEVELKPTELSRIRGMVAISAIANLLRKAQVNINYSEEQIELLRKDLNSVYDKFIKEFGLLSSQMNKNLIMDDSNAPLLLSLEKNYEKAISRETAKKTGEKAKPEKADKSDIFAKRTQYSHIRPSKAENIKDAFFFSLNEYNFLNLPYIAEIMGYSPEQAEKELLLNDLAYYDDKKGIITKELLLQGDLKEKLKYLTDVKSRSLIEENIPKDLNYLDINISFGANWVPADIVKDFLDEVVGRTDSSAILLPHDNSWSVSSKDTVQAEQKYGTTDVAFSRIFSSAINSRTISVTKKDATTGGTYIDKEATMVASQKVQELKNFWTDWIYEEENRAKRLENIYNEKFNVFATNAFSGEHLTLIGASNAIELRPHQKNAVQRTLSTGKILFDHTVGTGKTFTAIASVMELRRTNRANKPIITVPNHLTLEWASQFLRLYPNAEILVPSAKDFSKKRRKILLNRIATGDYDAIILAHSQFSMIESDKEFKKDLIKKEISLVEASIDSLRQSEGKDGRTVKQIETLRANLTFKLKELDNIKRDTDILTFEEMGIDCLIVDEAHEFKNLQYSTSMQRIGGLGNPKGSKKAFDMFVKTQSLLQKTNNKNLIFLTGTPISNSIAEMYTMQRYMQYDELERIGATHFDAWCKLNADAITDWEITPTQEYKLKTILSKFKNLPELIGQYKQFADVINNNDVNKMLLERGEKIPTPKIKGGKPFNIVLDRSASQTDFIGVLDENDQAPEGSLLYRSEHIPKKPKKGDDNMLVILNDAKKCSLDMRTIDESYEDNPNSKVNKMLEIAMETYEEWNDDRGVQIIFCDMSTPKGKDSEKEKEALESLISLSELGDEDADKELSKYSPDEIDSILNKNNFSVYSDIKEKLITFGVPEHEVAFIHDAKNDKQKEELFGKCRSGKVRFILGSTSKMGAGTNIQNRLVALHHLDVAWRPSDLEQREGRIIRQGNELYEKYGDSFEVGIYRYATKDTLDTVMWGTIERKAKFIEQIKKGVAGRETEDLGSESINASEMKALTSGNPLMMEQITLSGEVKKLEALEKEYKKSVMYLTSEVRTNKLSLERMINNLPDMEKDKNYFKTIEKSFEKARDFLEYTTEDLAFLEEARENRTFTKSEVLLKEKKEKIKVALSFTSSNGIAFENCTQLGNHVINSLGLLENNQHKILGQFHGFDVVVSKKQGTGSVLLEKEHSWELYNNFTSASSEKSIVKDFEKLLEQIPVRYERTLINVDKTSAHLEKLESVSGISGFKDKELLEQKRAKLFEVTKELEMEKQRKINKAMNGIKAESEAKENSIEEQIKSLKAVWEDTKKDISTKDLLKSMDISVLDNLNYKIVGNCLVLNDQLDRKDYISLEKICTKFGGDWDKRLQAIVFSNDGLLRIQESLNVKEDNLNTLVDTYEECQNNNSDSLSLVTRKSR